MDSVARTGAPSLANRRRRIAASTMIALPDLVRNPVALTAIDADGPHAISAERGPGGKVWLTCQCSASVEEGWCSHRLDLLCSRYDAVKGADAATLRAFEQITGGTSLSEEPLDPLASCLTGQCRRNIPFLDRDTTVDRRIDRFINDIVGASDLAQERIASQHRFVGQVFGARCRHQWSLFLIRVRLYYRRAGRAQ